MFATISSVLRDPVPYHGALGFLATITIERVNAVVGLLVGLATLVYLCLRIRREWSARKTQPLAED